MQAYVRSSHNPIASLFPHRDGLLSPFSAPHFKHSPTAVHCIHPPPLQAMKLVVAGASGFVATEIIRQCLESPKISSVIALARRPVSAPPDLSATADASKLQSVVISDYDVYPEEVKAQLAGVDACIWYTPLSIA